MRKPNSSEELGVFRETLRNLLLPRPRSLARTPSHLYHLLLLPSLLKIPGADSLRAFFHL
jgi:hypothetical protein